MKRETRRYGIAFAVLLVLLGGLLIWNLNAGSFPMTASQVLAILFGQGGDETASRIVWDIRLPRILGAALLGGALSISGFLLQTFFANPIASPFVLGISSGAKLTVALTMIFLLQRGILSNSFVLIGSAFVGAMLSMGFVLESRGAIWGSLRGRWAWRSSGPFFCPSQWARISWGRAMPRVWGFPSAGFVWS